MIWKILLQFEPHLSLCSWCCYPYDQDKSRFSCSLPSDLFNLSHHSCLSYVFSMICVFDLSFYSFHSVHCDVIAVAHACAFVWRLPWKIVPHENWVWWLYFRMCTKILFSCCIGWMERVDSAAVIRFEGNCLWYLLCFWFSEICCIFPLCYANRAVKL
jgi:hypothetical protein